eukprot:2995726-Prorocentrum_lima.AAC.1
MEDAGRQQPDGGATSGTFIDAAGANPTGSRGLARPVRARRQESRPWTRQTGSRTRTGVDLRR